MLIVPAMPNEKRAKGRSQVPRRKHRFPWLEVTMTERKPALVKSRKDIGEVVFPIEKLIAARAASASCVHIEADLVSDSGLTKRAKGRTRAAVKGIIATE